MKIKEFGETISTEIGEVFGAGYTINISEYPKNNGVVKHGLSILGFHENISPCIYLDEFYNRYEGGDMTLQEIVDLIIRIYKENALETNWDTTIFTDYDKAKNLLHLRLINAAKNQELLRTLPHREFLDLALVYTVEFPCEKVNGIGCIQVKNEHAAKWGVSEEALFSQAKDNMGRWNESTLENMEEILGRPFEELPSDIDFHTPLYVLSNNYRNHGAVQILDENVLKAASEIFGGDFMILPSSIHEVLLVPAVDEADDIERMLKMVQEVNDTQVPINEILSYRVYRYSSQAGRITIAA